jgi:serine protease AprX
MLSLLLAGAAQARPGHRADRVTVVVAARSGERAAAAKLVVRFGGRVDTRLDVVHGFTAHVPATAIRRLRRSAAVHSVTRDVAMHLSSDDPAAGTTTDSGTSAGTDTTAGSSAADSTAGVEPEDGAPTIDAPPAEIPTDQPADEVAHEVIDEAAHDTTSGTLAPEPVAEGADAAPADATVAGQDAVLDPTTPVAPQPEDGAARARASIDLIRQASGADATNLTGAGVDVAIIDSGVIGVGPLGGENKLVRGPDFSEDGWIPELRGLDTFGHGSHMAGVIAGDDPATGYRGIAPGARLVSVKVSGADGLTSLVRVLMALDWVRRNRDAQGLHIRVLNLSLGVDARRSYVHAPLAYASEQLWYRGITVVAAAGNQADETGRLDLPAADPFLIAVGATDTADTADTADDTVADFSSRDATRPPDFVAPGTHVVSMRVPGSTLDEEFPAARIGDGWFRGSGTSQATAVVSGLVALLLEARPNLTPDQVKALLKAGAVNLPADVSADGAGRVDLARSLALATPSLEAAAQHFQPAVMDLVVLWQELWAESSGSSSPVGVGENGWTGRRWSGIQWSGRRWSGRRWSSNDWGDGGS